MAFQDERGRLSWSLIVLLGLALAGCGGDSASSGTAAGTGSQTSTASEDTGTQQPVADIPDQNALAPEPPNKSIPADQEEDSPAHQVAQPGEVVENPIFADPLPVPVPADAQQDPTSRNGSDRNSQDDTDSGNDQDVADREPGGETEPEPEQPDPVAQRPTLQWDSPLTRVDGTKLYPGEISGYRVYYRLRHQEEFESLDVEGPDADSLELDNFAPGAYEFAVSTVDVEGLESRRSTPVSIDLI